MKREYAHEPPIVSVTQLNPEQCEVLLHENINAETRTTTGANGEEQTTVHPHHPVAGGHRGRHQGQRRRMDRNGPQAGARRAAA